MIREFFARLFARRVSRQTAPLSAADIAAADIDRRTRVRNRNPILAACKANGLTPNQTRTVFRFFERQAPNIGFASARQEAVNLAASLTRARDFSMRNENRHPGLESRAKQLQESNPSWSWLKCCEHAKREVA